MNAGQSTGKLIRNPILLEDSYLPEENVGSREYFTSILCPLVWSHNLNILFWGHGNYGKYTSAAHAKKLIETDYVEYSGRTLISAIVDCKKHPKSNQILTELLRQIDPDNPDVNDKKKIIYPHYHVEQKLSAANIVVVLLFRNIDCAEDHSFIHCLDTIHESSAWQKWYGNNSEQSPVIVTLSTAANYQWIHDRPESYTLSLFFNKNYEWIPPSSKEQLLKILENRSKAFYDGVLDQDVLLACAEAAVGSPKVAIDLLRSASIIAETSNSKKITLNHFRTALFEYEVSLVVDMLEPRSIHQKLILHSIVKLSKANGDINTTSVYDKYRSTYKMYAIKPLSKRGIYRHLYALYNEGIIHMQPVPYAKAGYTFKIAIAKGFVEFMEEASQRVLPPIIRKK
jgi:Cdc6-like AAA superfamily ATPase